jgi:multidrug efflux system membrane fusion protein
MDPLRMMGAAGQAIADLFGDPFTILVVALGFGLAAFLVVAVLRVASRTMGSMAKGMGISRKWLLTAAILAVSAYLGWQGLGMTSGSGARHAEAGRTPPMSPAPVHAMRVEKKAFPIVLTGLGTVQPTNIVTVRSRVDGQIESIAFEEGQMVHEGDLLVQIDAAPFQATLNQAIAKEAQDQASLKNAQQDLERTSVLAKQGNATLQLLDQRTAMVAQLTAQIQADRAAIDSARVQLNYTTIRSPLTGRVGFRLIDRGNIVHANDQNAMLTITQLQPISVIFTAPEQQLPAISAALKGGPLRVKALSADGRRELAEGTLALIDNQVDTASGTIRLKASFENGDNALWPGLSVTTRLYVGVLADVVVVPDTAVQRGPNGLYAYVISKDGKAELRDLKVSHLEAGSAVVEEGLSPGEQIVTSGHYRLQPGTPLQVLRSAEAPSVRKLE